MMYYDSQKGNDGLIYCELLKYVTYIYLYKSRSVSHTLWYCVHRDYLSRQSILRRKEVIDWTTWNIITVMVCAVYKFSYIFLYTNGKVY